MRAWDSEQVYFSGDEYYAELTHAIQGARHVVELECYIFEQDRIGLRLLEVLADAAKRGVRVRLLIDGVGSSDWGYFDLLTWRARGLRVAVYHSLPWQTRAAWILALLDIYWMKNFFKWVNRRNHRKICLVDHKIAFVGGMNISETHSAEFSGTIAWRDTMVRLNGPGILILHEAFESAWRTTQPQVIWRRLKRGLQEALRVETQAAVRLNNSRRSRFRYRQEIVNKIKFAKKRVWITNPYLVPPPRLLSALIFAAKAGRDVRIITAAVPSPKFMHLVARAYYPPLVAAGVKIYEYLPSPLHAKTSIIDEMATVGSSNFNYRSFIHDLEVDVRLDQEETLAKLERQFLADLEKTLPILLQNSPGQRLLSRLLERFFLLFRYWF